MATYTELHELRSEPSLKMRIMVAIADVAADVLAEPVPATPTERRDWAKIAIIRPDNEAREFIWALLISNQSATKQQIVAATDAAIKQAVADAVTARFGE